MHLQIYHEKELYNKENMACLKLSFVLDVSHRWHTDVNAHIKNRNVSSRLKLKLLYTAQ